MSAILIAGIGNIFLGDDAFGCEVVRALAEANLLSDVSVRDFGVRSYDLAYALTEHDLAILVDAMPRGEAPGTTYLLEIDLDEFRNVELAMPDGHSLNAVSALQMAQAFGGLRGKVYLVGCEPAVLENDTGEIGLSEPVRAAVPQAVDMIQSLVEKLLKTETAVAAGTLPA